MCIRHVGIIPDGNRRWAVNNHLNYADAYAITMKHLYEIISHTFEMGIEALSIYMLSTENLTRSREDLSAVLTAETDFIFCSLPTLAKEYQCKVVHAGESSLLPNDLAKSLRNIEGDTCNNSKHRLYLLVGYNPLDEVNAAMRASLNHRVNIKSLWVPETVDIVIRTAGGPTLLSNFLPLQCGYAQQFMVEAYFNDFTKADLNSIVLKASQTPQLRGK